MTAELLELEVPIEGTEVLNAQETQSRQDVGEEETDETDETEDEVEDNLDDDQDEDEDEEDEDA